MKLLDPHKAKWWHFWNPFSGILGGFIMGFIIVALAAFVDPYIGAGVYAAYLAIASHCIIKVFKKYENRPPD